MPAARILLVDDHDIARQGIAAFLSQPGWEICGEARTGREALQKAVELRPDVIVMDVLMPDLNGLDASRQLKKLLPNVQIVLLSGHEDGELIQPAFEAGVRAYIFKTQARSQLVPAVTALLAGMPFITPPVSAALRQQFEGQSQAGGQPQVADRSVTAREREIIQLLAEGRSNKEVASVLDISTKTVETHRASIMRKLSVESLSDLVVYAIRNKIIEA